MGAVIEIKKADLGDIDAIGKLASEIFPKCYAEILSPEQIRYMMALMYSKKSLKEQLCGGHTYYIAYVDKIAAGYVSVERESENLFHLQKIYVLENFRKIGLGKALFERAIKHVKCAHPEKCLMELNVNRQNKAIYFYEKMGMKKLRKGDFDIGGGFQMNDFIMGIEI